MLHLLDVSALTLVHSTFSAQAELGQDVTRRNSQLPAELPAPIEARGGGGVGRQHPSNPAVQGRLDHHPR